MDATGFSREMRRHRAQLENYVMVHFPARAGNISLRFVNGNFRAQGWQGRSFQKWKDNLRGGTILVRRGALRRGTYLLTRPGTAILRNNVAYARVHNEGFKGTVTVKAHDRRRFEAQKIETGRVLKSGRKQTRTVHTVSGITKVSSHSRKINIPRRQFMPTSASDSPVLQKAIVREIERSIKKIFEQ